MWDGDRIAQVLEHAIEDRTEESRRLHHRTDGATGTTSNSVGPIVMEGVIRDDLPTSLQSIDKHELSHDTLL